MDMKKWNEFVNENIDYKLKKTISIIYSKIVNLVNLGHNFFRISTDVFDDIKLNIFFYENNIGTYESNCNAIYVASLGDEIEINITILDNQVDYNKLISSISHELKHVYDAITDDDIHSFLNVGPINNLKNHFRNNPYMEFIHLVYLSLKHEKEARHHMIYDMLRWLKTYDKQQLIEEYKKTYIYKALLQLKDFNHLDFINKFDYDDLFNYTNIFLDELNMKKIKNKDELINFYQNYEIIFHEISKEYLQKASDIIDELIIDKKPYMEKINLSVFKNTKNENYLIDILKKQISNFSVII